MVEVLQIVGDLRAWRSRSGWSPSPGVVGVRRVPCWPWLLGTAAFASLGLLLAGTLRAEATLAAANLVYLLLLAGGAVVLPSSSYGAFGEVARWLPSGALGDAMRRGLHRRPIGWASLAVPARRGPSVGAVPDRRGRSSGSDLRLGRWLRPLAWATLVANVVLVVTGRRGPADRLGPRLPDLAAVHRLVVHPARRAGRARGDRVRQPHS